MLDLKKLITGFLILAAGASSSAWILSNTKPAEQTLTTPATATSSPTISTNAFVDSETATDATISTSTEAELDKPDNLTGALADSVLNNLVAANPNGVQTDANGNQLIAQPDSQTIIAQLSQNQGLTNLHVPNWDLEVAEQKLTISKNASPADITRYAGAIRNIFSQYFIQTNLESMLTNGSDPSDAQYISGQIQSALQDTVKVETPAPMANLQKSLVKLFVYEKNTLALAENASDDPVKNSLIFQAEQEKYNVALQDFSTQLQKSQISGALSFASPNQAPDHGIVAIFDHLMGIKTANAQWLTFDAANLGQMIVNFVKNTLIQIIKNLIVDLIQKKVLSWVQGSGAPRFIQGWASTLANSYTQSALNDLNSEMQCVNPTLAPQLKITLNAYYQAGGAGNVCAAQFSSQLGNNLNGFYNKFSNGGFVSFGQSLLPSNNYYGQLFFTAQSINQTAQNSQQAFQAKSVASQGFKGSEVCADGSDPNGESDQCTDDTGAILGPPDEDGCEIYGVDTLPQAEPNNGTCADGSEPEVTTPGNVTGQAFGSALDSTPKLVTAANDFAGLLNALLTSVLNTLADSAIKSATGAVNGALNGGGGRGSDSGIVGLQPPAGTAATPPGQPGVKCAPETQPALTISSDTPEVSAQFYGQGGEVDVNCASNGNCPADESADGDPTYTWTAPSSTSSGGGIDSSSPFTATYDQPGNYTVTVTASTDNSTASCSLSVVVATSTTSSGTGGSGL